MSGENLRIRQWMLGQKIEQINTPRGFVFLLQIFIGPGSEVLARVNSKFPFEQLREGALDEIIEAIRAQLRLVEQVRKKTRAAENS